MKKEGMHTRGVTERFRYRGQEVSSDKIVDSPISLPQLVSRGTAHGSDGWMVAHIRACAVCVCVCVCMHVCVCVCVCAYALSTICDVQCMCAYFGMLSFPCSSEEAYSPNSECLDSSLRMDWKSKSFG